MNIFKNLKKDTEKTGKNTTNDDKIVHEVFRLLSETHVLKTYARYGSNAGLDNVFFDGSCPACGKIHEEEFKTYQDENGLLYIICPTTNLRVYIIWS